MNVKSLWNDIEIYVWYVKLKETLMKNCMKYYDLFVPCFIFHSDVWQIWNKYENFLISNWFLPKNVIDF
jgi:hypothetical protein